jgi:beta-glucanase (GH16 family)
MDELTSAKLDTPDAPASMPGPKRRMSRRNLVIAALVVAAVLIAGAAVRAVNLGRDQHKAGWQLAWSDEFDGSSLDLSKWAPEDQSTFGNGNHELACLMARSDNVQVAGGQLTLRARRESSPLVCGDSDSRFPQGRSYSSAMLSTEGKASWHQGRFEVRAKLPLVAGRSKGLWPAFWLRPASGSGDGELDVMEAIGSADPQDPEAGTVHQTVWYDGKGTYPKQSRVAPVTGGPASGFHTYAAEWQNGVVRWYVDDRLTFERDASIAPWINKAFSGRFYIRLNLAVGGTFPGTPNAATDFPADMVVDYVRVFQWR